MSASPVIASSPKAAPAVPEKRRSAQGASVSAAQPSVYDRFLPVLLHALGWNGTERHLQDALPASGKMETLLEFRATLHRLNYVVAPSRFALADISSDDMPCLFSPAEGEDCWIVKERKASGFVSVYRAGSGLTQDVDPRDFTGQVYTVTALDTAPEEEARKHGWVLHAAASESGAIKKLFLMTLAVNLLALALPVYVMAVYDRAVFARSYATLGYLFLGIVLIAALEFFLRDARSRGLAYLGSRMESLITVSAFQRLLHFPASATEQASLSAQLSRLKTLETVREAFSGPLASTLLDLPFIALFIALVFLIGGNAGWIVVIFAVLMAGMVFTLGPVIRFQTQRLGQVNAERRKFLSEMTDNLDTIRNCRVEDVWLKRSQDLAASQLKCQFQLQRTNFIEQTVSHMLFVLTGTGIVFCGALQVMAGSVQPGALLALMALVWRVLTPVQTMFLNIDRLSQTMSVIRQIDQMMRLPIEYEPGKKPLLPRKFTGDLAADGIVFRYPNRPEPSLRGVSLEIAKGECVVLAGGAGSGKSTLLKLFAGLYPFQAGAVYVDGLDLRQLDLRDLRHNIGAVQERSHVFGGTLAENIRFAHPDATDADILSILIEMRVLPAAAAPERIHDSVSTLNSDSLLQKFALARAFVKPVPIYLLDEPSLHLDAQSDQIVRDKIAALRGKATVVMATVQPAYMRLANRVVLMQAGRIFSQGAPEAAIPILMQSQVKHTDARAA